MSPSLPGGHRRGRVCTRALVSAAVAACLATLGAATDAHGQSSEERGACPSDQNPVPNAAHSLVQAFGSPFRNIAGARPWTGPIVDDGEDVPIQETAGTADDEGDDAGTPAPTPAPGGNGATRRRRTRARIGSIVREFAFGKRDFINRDHDHCKKLLYNRTVDMEALQLCSCSASHVVRLDQSVSCPSACPFSQNWTADPCYKVCVFEEACGDFHLARTFPSRLTMECVPPCGMDFRDQIPGCAKCLEVGVCGQCYEGLELGPGGKYCTNKNWMHWRRFWIFMGIIAGFLCWYLVMLCFRKPVNLLVLDQAQQYYWRCLPFHIRTGTRINALNTLNVGPGGAATMAVEPNPTDIHVYSNHGVWSTNMMSLRQGQDVAGIGTGLFFRFLVFMIMFVLLVMLATGVLFETSEYNDALQASFDHSGVCFKDEPRQPEQAFLLLGVQDGTRRLLTRDEAAAREAAGPGASFEEDPAQAVVPWWSKLRSGDHETALLPRQEVVWRPKLKGARSRAKATLRSNMTAKEARYEAEQASRKLEETEEALKARSFAVLSVVYVLSFIMAIWFAFHIKLVTARYDITTKTMKDFCCVVGNLPADATDPKLLEAYFRDWLPKEVHYQVMEVSIAYDFSQDETAVEEAIDHIVIDVEREKGKLRWVPERPDYPDTEPREKDELTGRWRLFDPRFPSIDRFVLRFFDGTGPEEGTEVDGMEMRRLLRSLKCCGVAYIVLRSQQAVEWVVDHADAAPLFDIPGRRRRMLTFKATYSEPEDVHWEYHTLGDGWVKRLVVAVAALIGMLCIYFVSVAPLALMYMHVAHLPGIAVHWASEFCLGLLPGIGGAMLCNVLDFMTNHVGYVERAGRDDILMLFGFILTFITVFSDMILTLYLAEGTAYDESIQGGVVNFDRALARELFFCLVPGYVLCVAIIPSNAETMVPWAISRLLVRANPVRLRVAEKCLAPPVFEVAFKYTDVLTGVSAMLCMLPFLSPRCWKALFACVIMLLVVYLDTHWKVLRCYMVSRVNSDRMAWTAMILFSVPLTILGASAMFWGWEAEYFTARTGRALVVLEFFAYHLALSMISYAGSPRVLHTQARPAEDDYMDTSKRLLEKGIVATYMNTNPVNCLRAKYLDLDEAANVEGASKRDLLAFRAPHGASKREWVPFVQGKEHLLMEGVDVAERPLNFRQEIVSVVRRRQQIARPSILTG